MSHVASGTRVVGQARPLPMLTPAGGLGLAIMLSVAFWLALAMVLHLGGLL